LCPERTNSETDGGASPGAELSSSADGVEIEALRATPFRTVSYGTLLAALTEHDFPPQVVAMLPNDVEVTLDSITRRIGIQHKLPGIVVNADPRRAALDPVRPNGGVCATPITEALVKLGLAEGLLARDSC
jgi:hypothetical protein